MDPIPPHDPTSTQMYAEAGEAAVVVQRQLAANADRVTALANQLNVLNPDIVFTCARGSSDHAATFAKYLFETRLGIPTISQAPSISSIYGGPLLHVAGKPFICISQSGKSPDLLASATAAAKAGALVIALVNDAESPLAQIAQIVIPLYAGPETSVAATKSYIASLAALAHIGAAWAGDAALDAALATLPDQLAEAWELGTCEWTAGIDMLMRATSLFVLGRGMTLGIAQEAALKFKETSGIHAEAFSIAEVAHGPMALVKPGFPILAFPPLDKAVAGLDATLAIFAERGAKIAIAGDTLAKSNLSHPITLPLPANLHPVTGPIVMVQAFYALVNALAVKRGYDPDHPPLLNKVTQTV
jgi:glutamine---fructose-6-phosphate transaminase (isomerizing)